MLENWKQNGFVIAGLANIVGILVISQGFQSDTLPTTDPNVFSHFGLLMIMLWGLAYISAARHAGSSVLLPATFALEKLAYTVNWVIWNANQAPATLASIREQDFLGGLFFTAYGINDGLFMVFFAAVALLNWQKARTA